MNDTESIEKLLFGALQEYGERKARGVDATVEAYRVMDVATVAVTELSALRQRIAELEGERDRLRDAVLWALGENGRFAPREENDPPYWWRKELRRRAALER